MGNGDCECLHPISHMTSEKWEVGRKRGFPFLKYPTLDRRGRRRNGKGIRQHVTAKWCSLIGCSASRIVAYFDTIQHFGPLLAGNLLKEGNWDRNMMLGSLEYRVVQWPLLENSHIYLQWPGNPNFFCSTLYLRQYPPSALTVILSSCVVKSYSSLYLSWPLASTSSFASSSWEPVQKPIS